MIPVSSQIFLWQQYIEYFIRGIVILKIADNNQTIHSGNYVYTFLKKTPWPMQNQGGAVINLHVYKLYAWHIGGL